MKFYFFFLSFFLIAFIGHGQRPAFVENKDLKKYFEAYQVEGFFLVWNEKENSYTGYNPEALDKGYSPASTSKILNSLIGLETGIIPDENFIIPWDSVVRRVEIWNADHDLKTAFKNSTVWYYQELARRVGEEKMKYWVDKARYGNQDISGGIDQFWLSGGLRITPFQQIDFLRRLRHGELPFSARSMDITRKIMEVEKTEHYTLRAKTGWSGSDTLDFGWYVGYVETADNVCYFATGIWTKDLSNPNFGRARIDISRDILKDLNILK